MCDEILLMCFIQAFIISGRGGVVTYFPVGGKECPCR